MTTLYSPINDQFESILSDLVSSIVKDWDLNTCVSYCQDSMENKWLNSFTINDLVEQYEQHHECSILKEVIDWDEHLKTGEPDWQQFAKAEYHPVKITSMSGNTEIIRLLKDNEEPDFWSVYLVDHAGMSQCILDLDDKSEAEVLTESINTYYLE